MKSLPSSMSMIRTRHSLFTQNAPTISPFAVLLSLAGAWLTACGAPDGAGLQTSGAEAALCRDDSGCSGDDAVDGGARGSSNVTTTPTSGAACLVDADCAAGLECEVEHGAGFCKAHGGADDGSSDDSSAGSGGDGGVAGNTSGGSSSSACTRGSDCPSGQECEIEHGGSYCKNHGDDSQNGAASDPCEDDSDCALDERCESIGAGKRACLFDDRGDRSGSNSGPG